MLEPGSTFKVVAFAEALESGLVHEDDMIDCENRQYRVAGKTFHDDHELGIVPVRDVLIHSSNIGTLKIAAKIGKFKLYERARMMGFGSVTGIDFPSETTGDIPNPRGWNKLSLPTISFGQGVAVSPLQIALSYASIANGGLLLRPRVIKEVTGKDGRSGRTYEKQVIRRSMTEETAGRLEELLFQTVEEGTGKLAAIPNVRIAGKTGTAQRIREGFKGYDKYQYISSFVGFISDRDPKIVCLVMIDSPRGGYYGSQIAAPVFKRIINRALNIGKGPWTRMIAEKKNTPQSGVLPNLKGVKMSSAVEKLQKLGFTSSVVGDSTLVAQQFPIAGVTLNEGSDITLFSNIRTTEKVSTIKVPDLKGKAMRDAVQHLVQANLEVRINGSGVVKKQTPRAGTLVKLGAVCVIDCGKR
ncbi:Stage V sporulation protein D [subsurface metagenome]